MLVGEIAGVSHLIVGGDIYHADQKKAEAMAKAAGVDLFAARPKNKAS